jgi:hypothetical protein
MLPAPRALVVHSLFEALASAAGFVIYRIERQRLAMAIGIALIGLLFGLCNALV